ncbi:MAG: TrkH family potassium uptake protein [Candidatus Limiplasma sp.]|nr:TrkH family potassium uptake protein [Candidatus Limiplasma sp.]
MSSNPTEKRFSFFHRTIRPERIMVLGFLVVIIIGTILLTLPIASRSGESVGAHSALFTATSAVCVTGLIVVDTADTYTFFGQVVVLLLIQIGGLGFMIVATLLMVALGRRISLRNRVLIRESMNASSLSGMVRLTKSFSMLAVMIEMLGALVLSTRFVPLLGIRKGIWYSIFHAVSAFCNAGFDLFGGFRSLDRFQHDPLVLLTIAGLIILGGLGFSVISELLVNRFHFKRLTLHTKMVVTITSLLLVFGTLTILALEWGNPLTMGAPELNVGERLVNSFFQSTTLRTAGYASFDQANLTDSSKLIGVILMFIGASPASTGGGVKTTTFGVMLLLVLSVVRGRETVGLFGKQLAVSIVRRALTIVIISIGIVLACTMALSISEHGNGRSMLDLLYEAVSAFATVGLTSVGTASLNPVSQGLLVPIMFFGRVGPLTLALALASKLENNPRNRMHYPEEKIMIG